MGKKSSQAIRSYRDLIVWQKSIELVDAVYRATANFPKNEIYALTSQLRRAAISVPSNIAEGHARKSTREFVNFLSIARGSLAEVETQIVIAKRLGYLDDALEADTFSKTTEIGRLMAGLARSLLAKQ